MRKSRDLLKTMRDTKGTFHVKMTTINDRNEMDLTEAEDIKMRWQEYTEEVYRKDLHDPDNHNGILTHLKPDILECEVKWALGSITTNKASRGNGIPVELFQILKDDAVKVLHSICQQIWKTQQWPQDWERSVFIQSERKTMPKNVQTTAQLHSFHTLTRWKWSEVTQSCPILCDPMDYSLPGSSFHGIFQARVLEWVAISFSRGSSRPRDWTQVSPFAGRCWATWEAHTLAK